MSAWKIVPAECSFGMASAAGAAIWDTATEDHHRLATSAVNAAIAAAPPWQPTEEQVVELAKLLSSREGFAWEYCAREQWIGDARAALAWMAKTLGG